MATWPCRSTPTETTLLPLLLCTDPHSSHQGPPAGRWHLSFCCPSKPESGLHLVLLPFTCLLNTSPVHLPLIYGIKSEACIPETKEAAKARPWCLRWRHRTHDRGDPTYGKVVKDTGQPQIGRSLSATPPKCPLQSLMVQRPKRSQEHLNILVNCFLIYPQVLLIHWNIFT